MSARRIVSIMTGWMVAAGIGVFGPVPAMGQAPANSIRQIVSSVAGTRTGKTACSIQIVDLRTGQILYQANPSLAVAPASNMKALTTAAAMHLLGPDYRYHTTFGVLGDKLVVYGSGDPSINDPEMVQQTNIVDVIDRLATKLTEPIATSAVDAQGLPIATTRKLPTSIVVDLSIFDRQYRHPGWPARDIGQWFTAPVTAVNINDNCLDLYAGPGADRKGFVRIDPPCDFLKLNVNYVSRGNSTSTITAHWGKEQWNLIVNVGVGSRPTGPTWVVVNDPPALFAQLLKYRLNAAGVPITTEPTFDRMRRPDGQPLEGFEPLLEYVSPSLTDIITRTNKNSQNLFAECIFKTVGREFAGKMTAFAVGSWSSGGLAVKDFLATDVRVPITDLEIHDGSGLSSTNRVTAEALVGTLKYCLRQPWAKAYVNSLAISGRDGTMRKRLRRTVGDQRVYAKTGYIKNVTSLSGYVMDRSGEPAVAFSMLFNGDLSGVRQAQDQTCLELVKYVDQTATQVRAQRLGEQQ